MIKIYLIRKSIFVLKQEGIKAFVSKSIKFIWRVFRKVGLNFLIKHIVERLPHSVIYYWFELASNFPKSSDSNPLDLRYVDPSKIEYSGLFPSKQPGKYGIIRSGEWDRGSRRFDQTVFYMSIKRHFGQNIDWESTEIYRNYLSSIIEGASKEGCKSKKDLENYFGGIDALYKDIKQSGYKSQKELFAEKPTETRKMNADTIHPVLNEIGINIGRKGSLSRRGAGRHRLAIAKVLGIDKVPVIVRVRHKEWQKVRDEIRMAGSFQELSKMAKDNIDHPDLEDIVPKEWRLS